MAGAERYSAVAVFLHWLMALALVGMLAAGFYMGGMDNSDSNKFVLYQLHKSFGFTILALALFRLGWRLAHPVPPLPAEMPALEKIAARAAHWAFYGLMIGMPLVGWLGVSSSPMKIPTRIFGLFILPHLPFFHGDPNPGQTTRELFEWHEYMAYALIALLILHIAAALKHHFINKDSVLLAMMPAAFSRALKNMRGQHDEI
ncbi:MAG: cytochrome b [Alphaproteobacteria bacterium]